ncbi:DegT/DnrJ/EryC1/StrS family aminotransferase [Acuticoccus mangrovi]|uniref:DegT/DnrJ/EryC1/StrS aminotransferase family protein n=1 Tax=Acuticoccus mangrovi TaxID=2796142 RepID=A0A934IQ08_9HYPH|nr:DegT/DnrJ/EryC1/StrS aminotransferase family protein [Acuticoccus mangrovi]MBJ3776197.1 DegT/DnrJ/EryC1/StrS aminotransferase family protein [Acuticoccus mangrovi]
MTAILARVPATETQPIPLFDLKRQQARLRHDIDRRIAKVLDHGQFILGPEVTELEKEIAAFSGVKHSIGVSSGRDALIMALMAMGIGRGDAVLVPAFTFSATAAVVIAVGATPIFVDVDLVTYNMDADAVDAGVAEARRAGLTPKAVMPVDLFGRPADYAALKAAADVHGLPLIADAAQSFGAMAGGRRVGALAPISCISFYPTKPLGAFGDGGAVLTDDDDLAEAVRQIRTHGRQGDGDEAMRIGMTGRLDTIQAAILLAKLQVFKAELHRRAEIAALYDARLDEACELPPIDDDDVRSAWALYTVRVKNRDRIRAALGERQIGTGLFYRVPLHRHPAFRGLLSGNEKLAVAERLCDEVLSLPMGPDLTDEEVLQVADAVIEAV